jgi:hypothetical protein
MEGQKQIDYVFDEKGRIIGRRNSGEEDGDWLQMHYGDPMLPNLLTHFWHSSYGKIINTIKFVPFEEIQLNFGVFFGPKMRSHFWYKMPKGINNLYC